MLRMVDVCILMLKSDGIGMLFCFVVEMLRICGLFSVSCRLVLLLVIGVRIE